MRQLSSGGAFRSLYGLMRSHGGGKPADSQKLAAPVRLTAASQAALKGLSPQLRAAVQGAEKRLARRGRMQLLHEEAALIKSAQVVDPPKNQ